MQRVVVLEGELISPTNVRLNAPVTNVARTVQVIAHSQIEESPNAIKSLIDFLESLPPGTRTKEDIDRQLREDRDEPEDF